MSNVPSVDSAGRSLLQVFGLMNKIFGKGTAGIENFWEREAKSVRKLLNFTTFLENIIR